ncbi:GMC family oxidoreductase (plasmid) [Rhodococcus opacus]|uniref:GMC family oxidoreductase n=1 Tax=Rhodococcus opacus TaxID=37919 RepID=UPI0034D1FA31
MSQSPDHADVLVVGAGASGSVVAKTMAEAGFSVVCLEQGEWIEASDYASDKLEREILQEGRWHIDPNYRKRPEDYPCDVSESAIHPVMFNAVGGSTIHYAGEWTRLLPSDFRVRTLDGVGDDWPIDYAELAPYYDRIEQMMGISAHPGDPAYPPMTPAPNPALPLGELGRFAAEGFNKLGWHWWPGYNAIASRTHGRLSPCARRGTCMTGCPQGAKASVDITIWPDAIAAGARLVTGARVSRITTNSAGLATGAEWIDRNGVTHHQSADLVVLAGNGVGTARLLHLSTSQQFPDGLANRSGLVGKRLQLHPLATILGVYDTDLESWRGPFGESVTSSQFAESDISRGFPRGARLTVMPIAGPVETLWRFAEVLPLEERSGPALHDLIRRSFGRSFEIAVSIDDLPNENNSVSLSTELVDGDGIPAPKIRWQPPEHAEKALDWFSTRAEEFHRAAGATEVHRLDPGASVGWHLLGTARIGHDAETSVLDAFGRSHDVPNLAVVDGSTFVTSGSTNPTATIMAFALRAAEHLVKHARTQRIPV